MFVKLMMTEEELKHLIIRYFERKMVAMSFDPENLKIEMKDTQRPRPTWVKAAFRVSYEGIDH